MEYGDPLLCCCLGGVRSDVRGRNGVDVTSIFDDTQVAHFKLTDKENRERHEALTTFLQKTKYGAAKKSTFLTWVTYFVDGPGSKSAYQLEAFLAYWLNYFVFPSPPEDGLHPSVFPMAVLLAQGKRLPLAAWYLGVLYP